MGVCTSDVGDSIIRTSVSNDVLYLNTNHIKTNTNESLTKWPIFLVDATANMYHEKVSINSNISRGDLAKMICKSVIAKLSLINQCKNEKYMLTVEESPIVQIPLVTFNKTCRGINHGFCNLDNFENIWNHISFVGKTNFMSGWRKMVDVYDRDVKGSNKTILTGLIITDGKIQDANDLDEYLKDFRGNLCVRIVIIGFGDEHDRACRRYNKISKKYVGIYVSDFTSINNPDAIADDLLSVLDVKSVHICTDFTSMPKCADYDIQPSLSVVQYNNFISTTVDTELSSCMSCVVNRRVSLTPTDYG
jgi:hypothetical protein